MENNQSGSRDTRLSIEKAHKLLIRYPRFTEIYNDIMFCMKMSKIADEPQCMALEGQPGIGKTTLCRLILDEHPRRETVDGSRIPVFYSGVPSPATVKTLASKLLESLGDPAAGYGTLWSMNSRLIHFIKCCGVEFVILDDFHHLIDKEKGRVAVSLSDWLKALIKETGIPFLVIGLDNTVRQILNHNQQLSRLFAVRKTLSPFLWETQSPKSIKEFSTFINLVEKGIGMALPVDIPRVELLYRLYYATNGVVGNIMNLMRNAAVLAQTKKETSLSLEILAKAFNIRLAEHMNRSNPFVLNVPIPPLVPPPPINTPDKRENTKRKQPDLSKILSVH